MRRYFIGLLLPAIILTSSVSVLAQEQRIAAIVNDDVVSAQDLNERLGLVLLTSRIPDQEQARNRLSQQVLRGLIEESLQLQEAKRLSIDVAPQELERALSDIAGRNKMSVGEMQKMLQGNNINPKTLQNQLRAQISWLKIVNQRLRPQVNVTVDQLEIAVEEAKRNQGQPEYLLSEIVLPVDDPTQEKRVAADAARLVQTLSEGANFEALARQVSASATADRGGDVGWVQGAAIPAELASALDRLRPGDISQPLRSPVGFFIFQLRDRRLGTALATEDSDQEPAEVKLSQILFATDVRDDAQLTEGLKQASFVRDQLSDCASVDGLAEDMQAPASGDLGWLKVSDLPTILANAVRDLPTGEISDPLPGPAGVHLLMVCDRRGGGAIEVAESQVETVSAEDRQQISEQLERERLDRLARRYLRDLRKQAFIDIRI